MPYTSTDQKSFYTSEPMRGQGKTSLVGWKEICAYTGKSVNTLKKQITKEGFPAKKIGGQWESDKLWIDEWRKKYINRN